MSATTRPAHEVLQLAGQAAVAWAVFDPTWYLATYPAVRGDVGDADDAAVLQYYLEHGQQQGHSPNIWFDETWHLRTYPGVAAAVREGHFQSGFDAYCRVGFRTRSPHWLFNEAQYRQRYPDLRDDVLARDRSANGYDHFLKHGSREGRIGHLLFDPRVYQAQLAGDEQAKAAALGGHVHYLRRIQERRPEIRTSCYFDPVWYVRRYPSVIEGEWLCALQHYLTNDTPMEFDPLPEFSEAWYLERYKDVAAAIEAGERRNGYEHFLLNGALELRAPGASIDLRYYATKHAAVQADLDSGRVRDAFAHYLTIGRDQGLVALRPPEDHVTDRQAATLQRQRAESLLPRAARTVLDFTCHGEPEVSVIMLLRDRFALTLLTLTALRAGFHGAIELILLDAGSTDDTRRISRFVRGARVLRFDTEIDVVRGRNAALNIATSGVVLFLDNAADIAPGALAAALERLRSDARVGAVSGKLIGADEKLEAAGRIIWRDGSTESYLRGAPPAVPEANFVRDVDACSPMFLLLRGELLQSLGGFAEEFSADDAEVDLFLRIAAAGSRIVYDPAILVTRLEAGTNADAGAVQQALFRKHVNALRFKYIADPRVQVFARSAETPRRVLFVDDLIPLRQLGSGFVRSNDLIRVMAMLGFRVTVHPINPTAAGLATIYADMPDTVEVMHDRTHAGLGEFLAARQGYYDVIWVARTHNLDRIKPMLERITAGTGKPPRIVLDTEAVAALRRAELATLRGEAGFDVDAAIVEEFANAHFCQSIIAVTAQEAQKLRDLGFSDVAVIGHWREAQATPRAFAERNGMLLLGAMHQQDSPNRDALDWFVKDVLPIIEQSLGWETRLTVAGFVDPSVSLQAFRDHPRITLRGAVEDLAPLYDTHRIVVAPTRYAAGVPYKVHEAASYGVPVVATDLLRRQLGWHDGQDLITIDPQDPEGCANRIIALYRDPKLWQALRDNALERIRSENNRAQYEAAVRAVLEP